MVAIVFLLAGVGLGWGLFRASVSPPSGVGGIRTIPRPSASIPTGQGGLNTQSVFNKVSPAVVDINTLVDVGNGRQTPAAGTGMIVTSSGEVLTNNHVVEGSTSITVTIPGRSGQHSGKVLGIDRTDDVALVQIQGASNLPTVSFGNSSKLTVGQPVLAMGNAGGQGGSPAPVQGTVTGLNRSITASDPTNGPEMLSGLVETDASIQAGDSGGPVADSKGQVVGMITAGETSGFRQQTTVAGYAIPSNTATDIVKQIQAGHATSNVQLPPFPYMGVSIRDLDPTQAAQLGLNVSSGALVLQVVPGSPADQAGIQQNSVITRIDGSSVTDVKSL
ncbi:MAG: trypsin-like peptidase domain-containing protein, partial [Candidatus Dormibacteraeota bacterium]|nr:trypsin-like peptidase domain-containing protein [Candidatus Dormibacteraeota bacterium]